jgi:hypothetical protein
LAFAERPARFSGLIVRGLPLLFLFHPVVQNHLVDVLSIRQLIRWIDPAESFPFPDRRHLIFQVVQQDNFFVESRFEFSCFGAMTIAQLKASMALPGCPLSRYMMPKSVQTSGLFGSRERNFR